MGHYEGGSKGLGTRREGKKIVFMALDKLEVASGKQL